jgi:hypothetical protein
MTHSPSPLADEFASLRRAVQRDAAAARAGVARVLDVLLLTLLATLLGRLERIVRTWHEGAIAPLATEHQESVHTLSPLPLSLPALCVALGLLPGWIFRCFPARGMRPIPGRPRARGPGLHATPSPARAPPGVIPPRLRPSRRLKHLFRTPHPGPLSHVYFVAIS